jgi:hypothetical protein
MKKIVTVMGVLAFVTTIALAQSSGNFTYGNTGGMHCILNKGNGAITGGATCSSGTDCSALGCSPIPATGGACTADTDCASNFCINPTGATGAGQCAVGTCGGSINAGIKTNSGSGNVFLIRPSAVIGLLTDVAVQKNSTINIGTSSAFAGVDFSVNVTPPAGAPQPCVSPDYSVTYAARFIQISTNLFDVLGTLCTTVANPNPVGGVTTATGCFITFDESTLSAHSFDWVVGDPGGAGSNGNPSHCGSLQSGVYGIAANWKASLGNTGISESLTCVGPVNLTVQQNKIFSFDTVN